MDQNPEPHAVPSPEDPAAAAASEMEAGAGGLSPLEQAQQEVEQWKEVALRSRADLDNFRKRMAQEKTDALKYANGNLLESLLPVIDNFHFGLIAAEHDPAAQNILVGLNMVAKQLQDFLKEFGVEEIPAIGLPFDPNLHEAVSQLPNAEVAEGVVITQVRKGYKLKDRLLRPANVVVSTGPEAAQ